MRSCCVEDKGKKMLDSIDQPIMFTDLDFIIQYKNKAAQQINSVNNILDTNSLEGIIKSIQYGEIEKFKIYKDNKEIYIKAIKDLKSKVKGYCFGIK